MGVIGHVGSAEGTQERLKRVVNEIGSLDALVGSAEGTKRD